MNQPHLTGFHPNFEGGHTGGGQRPPTSSFLFPSTSRKNLRFDGYLEFSRAQRNYTFVDILAFFRIRTQALRHISQRH
ncbi:hypothetical protein TNCV_4939571 [Trichonephila clavipes]|nr:hypothetical protein TNCV_4939571 [Trichonephila clavipes]